MINVAARAQNDAAVLQRSLPEQSQIYVAPYAAQSVAYVTSVKHALTIPAPQ